MVLLRAKTVCQVKYIMDGDSFLLYHKRIAHLGLTSVSLYGSVIRYGVPQVVTE
ncbi:hypothetical protein BDV34DRAFT_206292 [Aspergillus parasiticus]|uniref:GAG-pre-integrase domain-containing protein n=1 Tax=Aspergillus parasiticus TaxID=5067 RepID=A0A5N6D357_ASPPA|nr:hypothetical protein BDV34DRAFT_206292 [Aspergillus parasiticus]